MPWEAQAANNNPELLVWRQEATCITTTVPGLYQLTLGFFTHSPLVIQVCVNGEPILTRAPSAGGPFDAHHHPPPRLSSGGGGGGGGGVGERSNDDHLLRQSYEGAKDRRAAANAMRTTGGGAAPGSPPRSPARRARAYRIGGHSDDDANAAAMGGWPLPPGGAVPLPAGEAGYVLRRTRHSVGDVTCVGLDEYVALPGPAAVAGRFESASKAQGFVALRKL